MRVLDLFCGAGGASMGIHRAGHEVVGLDHRQQPSYPFAMIQADAIEFPLEGFDAYWASPPCQAYLQGNEWAGHEYPELVGPIRRRLEKTGKPYVIENVPGAPLENTIRLCGEMFGLRVIRHRLFEIHGFLVPEPIHPKHKPPIRGIDDPKVEGERNLVSWYDCVAGHGGDGHCYRFSHWKQSMGMDWVDRREELTEAIPPDYAEYIFQWLPDNQYI